MDVATILLGCITILDELSEEMTDPRLLVVLTTLMGIYDEVERLVEQ